MGLFSKLKSVLSKTRDGISKKLTELFAKNKLGEEFYEELEDILEKEGKAELTCYYCNKTYEISGDEIREIHEK